MNEVYIDEQIERKDVLDKLQYAKNAELAFLILRKIIFHWMIFRQNITLKYRNLMLNGIVWFDDKCLK